MQPTSDCASFSDNSGQTQNAFIFLRNACKVHKIQNKNKNSTKHKRPWRCESAGLDRGSMKTTAGRGASTDRRVGSQRSQALRHLEAAQGITWLCLKNTIKTVAPTSRGQRTAAHTHANGEEKPMPQEVFPTTKDSKRTSLPSGVTRSRPQDAKEY
ncbi:hypothetical protein LSTR_LSTR003798 [Laodelphax striatellus]|uniref:Uncharacterized protein n=1 Tax=Laodelphax striatellus TaxID=195883 RepID=A0A482XFV9_LAOST|nr:hypothetical protein LSTR_LSTR003798 [Laodelphax striatellus]